MGIPVRVSRVERGDPSDAGSVRWIRAECVTACRTPLAGLDCGVVSHRSIRLAVFASGNGSNFEALARSAQQGMLGGDIVCLISDQPAAFALARARDLGIEALVLPSGRFRTRIEDEQPWLDALCERDVDVVLLAGFMRRLHKVVPAFDGRILNIHPSLLPAFPGLDAIGQAWAHGVAVTGCTVHLVEDEVDAGPIVAQAAVARRDDDTREALEARVHAAEHALFPVAVKRFLTEPWRVIGRRFEFGVGDGLVLPVRGAGSHG